MIRTEHQRQIKQKLTKYFRSYTLIFWAGSKPSNWFNNSSIVLCTSLSPPRLESIRVPPIESISSMKMIEGACSLAITNNSRTILDPSPIYFCTNSDPETRIKQQSVWWATARASRVFPVPGGPYINTPLGWAIPSDSNSSGCFIGSSITSFISLICFSNPPTMSYVASGTASTLIKLTNGSTWFLRLIWKYQKEEKKNVKLTYVRAKKKKKKSMAN